MANAIWKHPHLRTGASAVALLALAVTAGCAAQGEMTNLWHDPTLASGSIHKVFVVAIRKDPVRRRAWEDAFAEALTARGVAATASYRAFGEAAPDTQQVIDTVRRDGYDAVLLSSRLPDEATSRHVPGEYRQEQISDRNFYGYGRFHSYWVSVQDPGYTETDTIIRLQTDLWATGQGDAHLVWSGTLSTLESVTGRTVKRAVDEEIIPELVKQGVVPRETR
jgi:hypothetical protein